MEDIYPKDSEGDSDKTEGIPVRLEVVNIYQKDVDRIGGKKERPVSKMESAYQKDAEDVLRNADTGLFLLDMKETHHKTVQIKYHHIVLFRDF